MLDTHQCQQARLSRDPRFDGLFFIGVKTTGVYCRPVCRVRQPREQNVQYFPSAVAAAQAGFRPCLRCRPDSAPGSPAWLGTGATVQRALRLIDSGALQDEGLPALADRLGVSDRYLRQLFEQQVGVTPKTYALYQQALFAKQLLHQTQLPITAIALASGFHSVRRFNDCFKQLFQLAPSAVRRTRRVGGGVGIELFLSYRPPYRWPLLQAFLAGRLIEGLEWSDTDFYGRWFRLGNASGRFTAHHQPDASGFRVQLELDDLRGLGQVVRNIRRILDLDADIGQIETAVQAALNVPELTNSGLRLPGIWDPFEAGVRAILGQQVSVSAARRLVQQVVDAFNTGEQRENGIYFPTPTQLASSDLAFLRMPGARKNSLQALAQYAAGHDIADDPAALLNLRGIGPWTVNYIRMRGLSDPDIFLAGDLGVKKALVQFGGTVDPARAAPWSSYLTFHLWNQP